MFAVTGITTSPCDLVEISQNEVARKAARRAKSTGAGPHTPASRSLLWVKSFPVAEWSQGKGRLYLTVTTDTQEGAAS